jgi:hypothetical protein
MARVQNRLRRPGRPSCTRRHLEAIAELRAAILGAAPPEPELEVVFAVFLGSNGDGGKRAA